MIKNRKSIVGAVIIIIGLVVIYSLVIRPTPPDYEALYNRFYKTPTIQLDTLPTHLIANRNNAIAAYNNQDFPNAILHLESIVSQRPDDFTAEFYLGICYLETHQLDFAIVTFENLAEHDSNNVERALWYLALAHLKSKDARSCKTILKKHQILSKSSNLKQQSKLLLQKID